MLLTFYTCKDAIKRLDDYLDRELSSTDIARIETHIKLCRSCSKKYKFEQQTLAGIRAKLSDTSLPDDLMKRIMQLVEQETVKKDTI